MPQPYNYMLNLPDPTRSLTETLQLGQTLAAGRAKQQQIEQATQMQQQLQADLAGLGSNPTPSALANLSVKYPQLSEQFKRNFDMLSQAQQQNRLTQGSQVYSALLSGANDVAIEQLNQQAEAYRNSGDPAYAKALEDTAKLVEMNPEGAKTVAGLMLSSTMGPEKFTETFGKLGEERRKEELAPIEVKKAGADLGLTNAQIEETLANAEKLRADSKKALLELEAGQKGGAFVDPTKRFDAEKKLRDDYVRRTSNLTESQRNLNIIEQSADDVSGAGDIALVTSFMKMLDPGSVVRETEFATAQNAAGMYDRLKSYVDKGLTGAFLQPEQRKTFKRLAQKYMKAAEDQEKTVRRGLETVVKNYSLDAENVFGPPEEEQTAAPATATGVTPSYMKYATGAR